MGKWEILKDESIIENCLDNKIDEILESKEDKEIILCVGQVQSGKTNQIIDIIKKATKLEYNYIILFCGNTKSLLDQTKERLENQIGNIDKLNLIDIKNIPSNLENIKGTNVFAILKEIENIKKIKSMFDEINLKDAKILMIDDESDFGSISTEKDGTAIYSKINELYNERFYYCKILQVTATPYANILNNNSNKLKASKIICWKPNIKYTGWDVFNSKKDILYEKVDSNENSYNKNIQIGIAEHIFSSFNLYRWDINLKSDLLINTSLDTSDHHKDRISCDHYIEQTKNNNNLYTTFLKDRMLKEDYEDFIKVYLENYEIVVLNSKNDNILDNEKIYKIIIGGTLISRGNTYENLMVELLLNSPKDVINVDTLLQRCRWFGYRDDLRLKYMKIIMSNKIYDALIQCKDYIHLFKEGIHSMTLIENELRIIESNEHLVRGTSNEKSK